MTAEPLTSEELARLVLRGIVKITVQADTEHRDRMRKWRKRRAEKLASMAAQECVAVQS